MKKRPALKQTGMRLSGKNVEYLNARVNKENEKDEDLKITISDVVRHAIDVLEKEEPVST